MDSPDTRAQSRHSYGREAPFVGLIHGAAIITGYLMHKNQLASDILKIIKKHYHIISRQFSERLHSMARELATAILSLRAQKMDIPVCNFTEYIHFAVQLNIFRSDRNKSMKKY